jgi:hypothetical protein
VGEQASRRVPSHAVAWAGEQQQPGTAPPSPLHAQAPFEHPAGTPSYQRPQGVTAVHRPASTSTSSSVPLVQAPTEGTVAGSGQPVNAPPSAGQQPIGEQPREHVSRTCQT